jgi:hypothetical protein
MMERELAPDGAVRPVNGVLPITLQAREEGTGGLMVPPENAAEAAVAAGLQVIPIQRLSPVPVCRGGPGGSSAVEKSWRGKFWPPEPTDDGGTRGLTVRCAMPMRAWLWGENIFKFGVDASVLIA